MFRSPPGGNNSHIRGSPFGKQLGDGPIHQLATVIEKTSAEDWQRRSQALSSLVATIPRGGAYKAEETWFNSPPTLRHLAWPICELLKDLRSTVVKRTCESCIELFSKCQSEARYLFKDIMPTILGLHGQTVAVIRQAVQEMTIEAMGVCPCKMAMPIWLDRLKSDKSKTVREACCLYLGVGLSEWTDAGYLSAQIWEQVGKALVKALRDRDPSVRKNAKRGLETVYQQQAEIFDRLLEDSALVRDHRVKKLLQRIQSGEVVGDDVSVASSRVGSVASRGTYRGGGSVSGGRRNSSRGATGRAGDGPLGIPMTIGVRTTTASSRPPASRSVNNSVPKAMPKGAGLGPPGRVSSPFHSAVESPAITYQKTDEPKGTPLQGSANVKTEAILSNSFDTNETTDTDAPVIASADALREFAKTRGSRRSSILQERLSNSEAVTAAPAVSPTPNSDNGVNTGSTLDLDDILKDDPPEEVNLSAEEGESSILANEHSAASPPSSVAVTTKSPVAMTPPATMTIVVPEHTKIGQELLEAHKKHIDQIMETLKVEMDALKEFELLLIEGGSLRPTEDEVLEYFESVGLCVDQRTKAGAKLQKKMDKISGGGAAGA